MDLPVMPPVRPMLARLVRDLDDVPLGCAFEPKWDGFRSVVFKDGDEVEIGSRNERPMTRYFPELVAAFREQLPTRCVVDGEIVLVGESGDRLDFERLQLRLHPAASRVRLLSEQTPALFVAFDLLALGDDDCTSLPLAQRRARLEDALGDLAPPLHLTETTTDVELARRWFHRFEGAGLDGVVAKPLDGRYVQDKRAMVKVKHERTADCVVAGYRVHKSGGPVVGSLLLGLYDDAGDLANIGVVGAFPMARRRALYDELQPLVTGFAGHPWDWGRWAEEHPEEARRFSGGGSRWNAGKDPSFVALRPERVLEVRYDHMEGRRLRHTGQFVRWRPDRDPRSCTYDQLEVPVRYDLAEVLGSSRRP